jgi:hypothetical protein
MPIRRETSKARRLNEKAMEQLREIVRSGGGGPGGPGGGTSGDIYGLITGHFYETQHCRKDDEESQRALWDELKDDILAEHVKRSPGSRPWAWWKWEATEMRRVMGLDRDIVGDETDRLPAFEDPNLPAHFKRNYFGKPNIYDGFLYESEEEYLERLGLLTREEKAATQ